MFVDERGSAVARLYRHMDGHVNTHGKELAKFLAGKKLVAGLPLHEYNEVRFVGMGDLAVRTITQLKINHSAMMSRYGPGHDNPVDDPGQFYLVSNMWDNQPYVYHVEGLNDGSIHMEVTVYGEPMFAGSPRLLVEQAEWIQNKINNR